MKLIFNIFFIFTLLLSGLNLAYGKIINLYDKPEINAKIVGTIDPAKGITVIFTPKNGAYMKVADPSNGNVGWIKHDDIKNGDQVTFTHSIIQDGQGAHSYQFVEYGSTAGAGAQAYPPQSQPQQMTPEQMKQIKAIQDQTQAIQNLMSKTVNDMTNMFFKLGPQNQQQPSVSKQTNSVPPQPQPIIPPKEVTPTKK